MNWFVAIATYVVIWWVTIFAVLPWGVKPSESDDAMGQAAGAPANPRLWLKVGVTSAVAAVLWLVVYWVVTDHVVKLG